MTNSNLGCRHTRPRFATVVCVLTATLACIACEDAKPPPGTTPDSFEYHGKLEIGSAMAAVREVCDGSRCRLADNPTFNEVEYVSDASANIVGILLRTPAPDPPNVKEEQERFDQTRAIIQGELGQGETFLNSGNPTYWPGRGGDERVVSLTIDEGRTVMAVGPVGVDADKITEDGAARDPKKVQAYWSKIVKMKAFATKRAH